MDAGSWMEAFERASERLVEDWQVKLVTTGLLAEGVFPFELISLFALAVFIDLVTKWMALAHKYLEAKGEEDRDMVSCILAIPSAHRAGMISSRQMKRQFAGKMVLYILLTVGGGAADRLLASVGRPDLFMEMCVSYLAASEMADFDGYGIGSGDPDMRWDLLYVPDYGDGGRLVPGGELIRGKTKYYRKQRGGLLCL